MKFLYYIFIGCATAPSSFAVMSRSDLIAVNSIEKELDQLLMKKPLNWQDQVRIKIDQLKNQYVPKGYSQDKMSNFTMQLIPAVQMPERKSDNQEIKTDSYKQGEVDFVSSLIGRIDNLFAIPVDVRDDSWESSVNQLVFDLSVQDRDRAQTYLKKLYTPTIATAPELTSVAKVGVKPSGVDSLHQPAGFIDDPSMHEKLVSVEQAVVLPEQSKEKIAQELDDLIAIPKQDRAENWQDLVNRHIFSLSVIDTALANKYFKKIHIKKKPKAVAEREVVEPIAIEPDAIPVVELVPEKELENVLVGDQSVIYPNKDEIINTIDGLLKVPATEKNDAWEKKCNALIFDLALVDKDLAHVYLKKIYSHIVVPKSSSAVVFGGPSPPPPMPGVAPVVKAGGPPPPPPMPGAGPIARAGGPTPPPMLGAKKVGVIESQKPLVLTPSVLRKMDAQEVLRLFDEHLQKLPSSWNVLSEERVEVKTKYGSRVEIIRGAPDLAWKNTVGTLRKSLLEKQVLSESDIDARITEKIDQVRASKKAAVPTIPSIVEQKSSEEPTKEDIERQIKALLGNPQTSEISWLVGIKRGIKKLDTFDHDAALKYQEDFIKLLPKEKRFIRP